MICDAGLAAVRHVERRDDSASRSARARPSQAFLRRAFTGVVGIRHTFRKYSVKFNLTHWVPVAGFRPHFSGELVCNEFATLPGHWICASSGVNQQRQTPVARFFCARRHQIAILRQLCKESIR